MSRIFWTVFPFFLSDSKQIYTISQHTQRNLLQMWFLIEKYNYNDETEHIFVTFIKCSLRFPPTY